MDSAGQKLAYVYFEEEPGRRSAAKLLTKDEPRAANIVKLSVFITSRRIALLVICAKFLGGRRSQGKENIPTSSSFS
jgi:hypothetical protein